VFTGVVGEAVLLSLDAIYRTGEIVAVGLFFVTVLN